MKTTISTLLIQILVTGIASLILMIIIDYILGPKAEYLNAWDILNRIAGRDSGLAEGELLKRFGLLVTTAITIFANMMLGGILVLLYRLIKSTII